MKIAALAKPTGWHVQDMRRAATRQGHVLVVGSWRNLQGSVGTSHNDVGIAQTGDVTLEDCDAVVLRTIPAGSLEQIIFRLDLLQRVEAHGVCVINSPRAIEVAVDKYLALARMQAAGLPVPDTIVCQRAADAMAAFEKLGGHVVLKPLFGSEGFGITDLKDPAIAERVFAALERIGSVLYLQRFIAQDGSDLRLFVLGDRVLAAMRRSSPDWRTNIALGGKGQAFKPDADICELALGAARACKTQVAGVDVLIDTDGQPHVLEVNAVPGWQTIAAVTGVDVAAELLDFVLRCVQGGKKQEPEGTVIGAGPIEQ